ncbi:unnamed protein product [Caenorhabditis brenneri]
MTAWSSLPPELKQHVIKELGVVSRYCLRNTSRLDRKLVDSTRLKVPRVRFGYKDGRCLVVIYSRIEKFLRFELTESEDGVLYDKFENTLDPELANQMGFPSNHFYLLPLATYILQIFLAHDAIQIEILELEFPSIGKTNVERHNTLVKIFIMMMGKKLHVKEIVFPHSNDPYFSIDEIEKYVEFEGLNVIRYLSLFIGSESMVPLISYSVTHKDKYGRSIYRTCFATENIETRNEFILEASTDEARFSKDQMMVFQNPQEKFDPETKERKEDGEIVIKTTLTKCGKLVQIAHKSFEKQFMDNFDTTKCGLGDLCERCSDPFDYWYTQNLARRIYDEPFWTGIVHHPPDRDDLYEHTLDELRAHFEREQSRNAEIAKTERERQVIAYCFKPFEKEDDEELNDATMKTIIYIGIFVFFPVSLAFMMYLWL